jgi:phospholipase/carboxylesterase
MPYVKFLFPTAPVQRVTLNMGMEMPAWFDINSLDPTDLKEDAEGILESAAYVMGLVQKEIENGIPPERIALVGFSQGGAISLTAGMLQIPKGIGLR